MKSLSLKLWRFCTEPIWWVYERTSLQTSELHKYLFHIASQIRPSPLPFSAMFPERERTVHIKGTFWWFLNCPVYDSFFLPHHRVFTLFYLLTKYRAITPEAGTYLISLLVWNLPMQNDDDMPNNFKDFPSPRKGGGLLQSFSLLMLIPEDGEPSQPSAWGSQGPSGGAWHRWHALPSKILIVAVSHLQLSKTMTDLLFFWGEGKNPKGIVLGVHHLQRGLFGRKSS